MNAILRYNKYEEKEEPLPRRWVFRPEQFHSNRPWKKMYLAKKRKIPLLQEIVKTKKLDRVPPSISIK